MRTMSNLTELKTKLSALRGIEEAAVEVQRDCGKFYERIVADIAETEARIIRLHGVANLVNK